MNEAVTVDAQHVYVHALPRRCTLVEEVMMAPTMALTAEGTNHSLGALAGYSPSGQRATCALRDRR